MTRKFSINQQGMTLVEIMVAASLLGGLAIAGMTLFKTQTVGQKTVEANYEITNLFQQIRVVLSDQQNCTQTFTGLNPNTFVSPGTFTLQKKRVGAAGYDPVYALNVNLSGNVKITSYRLERTPVTNLALNETWLKINFSKGKSTLMENSTRMMKVIVAPSPASTNTSITSCYAYNNSTDTYWMQGTPPDIYFTAGSVGIGTATPLNTSTLHLETIFNSGGTHALEIRGPVADNNWGGGIHLTSNNTTTTEASIITSTTGLTLNNLKATPIRLFTNNLERMQIDSAGNVGIGTTPATRLDVLAPDASGVTIRNATENTTTMQLFTAGAGTANRRARIQGWQNSVGAIPLILQENGSNVGIGTATPNYKLDVIGSFSAGVDGVLDKRSMRLEDEVTSVLTGSAGVTQLRIKDSTFAESANGATYITHEGDGTTAIGNSRNSSSLSVLRFYTTPDAGSPTERMRIDSTGRMGVGTTTPSNILTLSGNGSIINGSLGFNRNPTDGSLPTGGAAGSPRFQFSPNATYFGIEAYNTAGASTGGLYILGSNGNVGIANGAPAYKLDVTGDIRATNMWATTGYWYSDARLKKDIKPFEDGLEKILRLEPKSYTWKKDGKKDTGFIAQDVKKVLPDLVEESKDKEKSLTVKLMGLIPLIVNAIQELYEMVTGTQEDQKQLGREVVQLKKENQELRARLDRQDAVLRRLEEKSERP